MGNWMRNRQWLIFHFPQIFIIDIEKSKFEMENVYNLIEMISTSIWFTTFNFPYSHLPQMSWEENTPSGFDIIEHRIVLALPRKKRWKEQTFSINDQRIMWKWRNYCQRIIPPVPVWWDWQGKRLEDNNEDKRFPSASHVWNNKWFKML